MTDWRVKGLKGDRGALRDKTKVGVRPGRTLGRPGVWRLQRRIMQRSKPMKVQDLASEGPKFKSRFCH